MNAKHFDIITVLGATAGGKTSFAANLAHEIDAEIISADSRQVYRDMNLGTGKDYEDYTVKGKKIPYHLIDILDAGKKYHVYQYQKDFLQAYNKIKAKNKQAILCGGTGMYIEAVLKGYNLVNVPENPKLRELLEKKSMDELEQMLAQFKKLHNTTDTTNRKRLIRAIEIEHFSKDKKANQLPEWSYIVFGIKFDRDARRRRITARLEERINSGLVEEVKALHEKGVDYETLMYYGLEYKFVALHLLGKLSKQEMFDKLNTAIHQFSKRQMTWFRKMERNGFKIHWIDGHETMNEKIKRAKNILQSAN